MCGIVGLFLKNKELEPDLGRLTALMLREMRDRGPDSAGFAVYGDEAEGTKITLLSKTNETDWSALAKGLSKATGEEVDVKTVGNHALFTTPAEGLGARRWIIENAPDVTVLAAGKSIELYKGIGDPDAVIEDYALAKRTGTHAIGHTRMATESAITTAGSHPFSTGEDTCLVHNGSLSNHNRLRDNLRRYGESFQTENDTEVAAGYLSWRVREGDTLNEALERGLEDLDGFYTFAVGVRNGFAVLRDPIACKPAVIAENDDWVAMSSEFRAIAQLPGAREANIWEPEPSTIYAWSHN